MAGTSPAMTLIWAARHKRGHDKGKRNTSPVIPGRRVSAGPGIQLQARRLFLDSGFAAFGRAPE